MIPELFPVWKRWIETHDAVLTCLSEFPADRYGWQPAPTATSAAQIIRHVARGEILYARCALEELSEPRPELPVEDHASALAALDAGKEAASRAFGQLSLAALDRTITDEWHPLGPRVEGPLTALWFLEQMIRHKAYHLGQLYFLEMLLESS